MADTLQYQGIVITLEQLTDRLWRWEVLPPAAVLGLREQSGETRGSRADAIFDARQAIESQTGIYSGPPHLKMGKSRARLRNE